MMWFEVQDVMTGEHQRRHEAESEWRSDFRATVKTTWRDAGKRQGDVAKWLNVSPVEVQEILKTAD